MEGVDVVGGMESGGGFGSLGSSLERLERLRGVLPPERRLRVRLGGEDGEVITEPAVSTDENDDDVFASAGLDEYGVNKLKKSYVYPCNLYKYISFVQLLYC